MFDKYPDKITKQFRLPSFYHFKFKNPRTKITAILVIALTITIASFVLRNVFYADETSSPFTIAGIIYGQDTKGVLAGVDITLSDPTNSKITPITTKTNLSGGYTLQIPSRSFTDLTIIKDGYWDIETKISNSDTSGKFTLNLAMKPGFGKEDAQVFVPNFNIAPGASDHFGLSLEPFNSSPASLTVITPNGKTYAETPASFLSFYNPATGQYSSYDQTKAIVEMKMAEVTRVANSCKTNGGSVYVTYETFDKNADPDNWHRMKVTMPNGTQPICDTSKISDSTIKAQLTTPKYPLLPEGYIYYYPSVNMVSSGVQSNIFVAIEAPDSTNLNCTLNGCTCGENWGRNFSLYRGQVIASSKPSQNLSKSLIKTAQAVQILPKPIPTSNAILVRGRAKTEPVTLISKQTGTQFFFANPYMSDTTINDFRLKYNNRTLTFQEAYAQNLIYSKLNYIIPGQDDKPIYFDQNLPNISFPPGTAFETTPVKPDLQFTVQKLENAKITKPATVINVEVPDEISISDISKIAQGFDKFTPEESDRLRKQYKLLEEAATINIATNKILSGQSVGEYVVYLERNNKRIIIPDNQQSISKKNSLIPAAKAANNRNIFTVDEDSFYIDPQLYTIDFINDWAAHENLTQKDTFGLSVAKDAISYQSKYYEIFGDPLDNSTDRNIKIVKTGYHGYAIIIERIFQRALEKYNKSSEAEKVKIDNQCKKTFGKTLLEIIDIYKAPNSPEKTETIKALLSFTSCNAFYMDATDMISADTQCVLFHNDTLYRNILLHEMSHSWRGGSEKYNIYSPIDFTNFEEGLAELAPTIIVDAENSTMPPVHRIVLDYDAINKSHYYNLDELPINPISDEILFTGGGFPLDENAWSRTVPSYFVYKLYQSDPVYFKELVSNLSWQKLLYLIKYGDPLKKSTMPLVENLPIQEWVLANLGFLYGQPESFKSILPDIYERYIKSEESKYTLFSSEPSFYGLWCRLSDLMPAHTDPAFDMTEKEFQEGKEKMLQGCADHYSQRNNFLLTWGDYPHKTGVPDKEAFIFKYNQTQHSSELSEVRKGGLYGEYIIDDLVNMFKKETDGNHQILFVQKDLDTSRGQKDRLVKLEPVFIQDHKNQGSGIWGITNLPNNTDILLQKINSNNTAQSLATTKVLNGIYSFPVADTMNGRFKISIPSAKYDKYINKWKGPYEQNIITDQDEPEIKHPSFENNTLSFETSELSVSFAEYGDQKDKYPNISFGISNEGAEFKSGNRSLTLSDLDPGKTYHYRIWAIDRSGNVSHTGDQTFTIKTVINPSYINISNITKTSAHIGWDAWPKSTPFYSMIRYGTATGQYTNTTTAKREPPESTSSSASTSSSSQSVQSSDSTWNKYSYDLTGLSPGKRYYYQVGLSPDPNPANATWSPEQLPFYTKSTLTFNACPTCWEPSVINWGYIGASIYDMRFSVYDATSDGVFLPEVFDSTVSFKLVQDNVTKIDDPDLKACTHPYIRYSPAVCNGYRFNPLQATDRITLKACRTDTDCAVMFFTPVPRLFPEIFTEGTLDLLTGINQASSASTQSQATSSQTNPQTSAQPKNQSSASTITYLAQNASQGLIQYKTEDSQISQIEYGTDPNKLSQIVSSPIKTQAHIIHLPNLKSRTYYYRIVTTDKDDKKHYSQTYTLNHGNRFYRFFGNLWERVKSIF